MSNVCDFDKLNGTCNISPETAELIIWMTLKETRQTRICRVKGMTIWYIMHRCLVMLLRGGKVNAVDF